MHGEAQYSSVPVQPRPEMVMPNESGRSPRVVIYVSEERRRRLRRLASRRFENEAGYASVSRVVNEILDSCLEEYEARVGNQEDEPKRKRK